MTWHVQVQLCQSSYAICFQIQEHGLHRGREPVLDLKGTVDQPLFLGERVLQTSRKLAGAKQCSPGLAACGGWGVGLSMLSAHTKNGGRIHDV